MITDCGRRRNRRARHEYAPDPVAIGPLWIRDHRVWRLSAIRVSIVVGSVIDGRPDVPGKAATGAGP
ncbi:hypothetical protein [Amycolatopsis sp. NPDC059021]|uniref:hypothetical protein n=1 Tax=Amycolatopsis sp. NPDC059021 TaxID=3346704 RepID=UPI00366F5C47